MQVGAEEEIQGIGRVARHRLRGGSLMYPVSPQSEIEIMLLAASAQDILTRYYHIPTPLAYARNNNLDTRPENIIELIEARAKSCATRGREHAVPK